MYTCYAHWLQFIYIGLDDLLRYTYLGKDVGLNSLTNSHVTEQTSEITKSETTIVTSIR